MFQILKEQKLLTGIMISLLLLSIVCQIIIGVMYQKLINEAENLSTTENRQLKLCKLKFQNCFQMNGCVPNISVFVDKFISHLTFTRITLTSLGHVAAQLIMLSVFTAGIGACLAIIAGETLLRIVPYYIIGMIGLYIYFAVSGIVDIQGRKSNLKINLMDYLENHMLSRLVNNEQEEAGSKETEIKQKEIPVHKAREKELKAAIAAFSEDELEELLKELLV